MQYQFTHHKGQRLAYWSRGSGPALVLLHGFCEDSSMWWPYAEPFTKNHQVIGIDLCGFGKSDLSQSSSMRRCAESVAAVLDVLNIEKAALLGHSMGGYIALAFAEQYPQRLSGLGLFHSQPFADSPAKKEEREKSIFFIERRGVKPFVGQLAKKLFGRRFAERQPEAIAAFIEQAASYSPEAVIAAARAMKNRPSRSAVLAKIQVPVLFLVGKEDQAIPRGNSLRQLVLPDWALLHIWAEVGHIGTQEAPEASRAAIQQWLGYL